MITITKDHKKNRLVADEADAVFVVVPFECGDRDGNASVSNINHSPHLCYSKGKCKKMSYSGAVKARTKLMADPRGCVVMDAPFEDFSFLVPADDDDLSDCGFSLVTLFFHGDVKTVEKKLAAIMGE